MLYSILVVTSSIRPSSQVRSTQDAARVRWPRSRKRVGSGFGLVLHIPASWGGYVPEDGCFGSASTWSTEQDIHKRYRVQTHERSLVMGNELGVLPPRQKLQTEQSTEQTRQTVLVLVLVPGNYRSTRNTGPSFVLFPSPTRICPSQKPASISPPTAANFPSEPHRSLCFASGTSSRRGRIRTIFIALCCQFHRRAFVHHSHSQ